MLDAALISSKIKTKKCPLAFAIRRSLGASESIISVVQWRQKELKKLERKEQETSQNNIQREMWS